MHTVAKPEGLPTEAWVLMLEELYRVIFAHADLHCMRVKVLSKRELAVFDPHKHLGDPEMRAHLRDSIRACADPAIRRIVMLTLLGNVA